MKWNENMISKNSTNWKRKCARKVYVSRRSHDAAISTTSPPTGSHIWNNIGGKLKALLISLDFDENVHYLIPDLIHSLCMDLIAKSGYTQRIHVRSFPAFYLN